MVGIGELINQSINAYMANSTFINSTPCVITSVEPNNMVKAKLISDSVVYTVPNLSGVILKVGDHAKLYYYGLRPTQEKSYIGLGINASPNVLTSVEGDYTLGFIDDTEQTIAEIDSTGSSLSFGVLSANINLMGSIDGLFTIKIYVDDVLKQTYRYSLIEDKYDLISFSQMIEIPNDDFNIKITGVGGCAIVGVTAFVYGYGIESRLVFEPTDDSDYIWRELQDHTNVIYYKGESIRPQIPEKLNDLPIKILYATSFDNSSVQAVYIPEGVEEIQ